MLNAEMQKLKQQNYFPIPNAVFDLDLTDGEILVYAFLLRCEDRRMDCPLEPQEGTQPC